MTRQWESQLAWGWVPNFAFHTSATVAPQLMPVDFTVLSVKDLWAGQRDITHLMIWLFAASLRLQFRSPRHGRSEGLGVDTALQCCPDDSLPSTDRTDWWSYQKYTSVDQSTSIFPSQRGTGWSYFSDFRPVDPFRRYSRSKSKVVRNRAEFWTFFAQPNFSGRAFLKCPCYQLSPLPRGTSPVKVSWGYSY